MERSREHGQLGFPGFERQALDALDARGYTSLRALAHEGCRSRSTASRPATFVCSDGKVYWVKANVQRGLTAELVAGRLAAEVGAGPMARVVRIDVAALALEPDMQQFSGEVVGTEDLPNTVNARELQPLMAGARFDPGAIDGRSRALVVAFQTWLGAQDEQVLIRLTDGRVSSIDHGDCFADCSALTDPRVVLTPIPGAGERVGREERDVRAAVDRIAAVSNDDILEAVAGMPSGDRWQSDIERRLQIARWLAHRRDRLSEVMQSWLHR